MDISKLSDEELQKIANKSSTPRGLEQMSDEELQQIANKNSFNVPAAATGALDSISFGYLPQIIAGGKKVGGLITGEPVDYTAERDSAADTLKAIREDSPNSYLTGQVGGGLVSAVPAGLVGAGAKAATAGARIGQAALSGARAGAAYGLLSNPGETKGKISPLQLKERIEAGGYGAAGGGLLGGAGGVIAEVPGALKSAAEGLAINVFKPGKKEAKLLGRDGLKEAGRVAIRQKVISSDPHKTLENVTQRREQVGQAIAEEIGRVSKYGPAKLSRSEIAENVLKNMSPEAGIPGAAEESRALKKLVDEFMSGDEFMDLGKAQKIKSALQKKAGFNKNTALQELTPAEKVNRELYFEMNKAVDNAADVAMESAGTGGGAKRMQTLRNQYKNLSRLETMAADRSASLTANRQTSLTDYMTALGGGAMAFAHNPQAMAQNLVLALGAGATNKLLRTYGRGAGIKGLDALATALEKGQSLTPHKETLAALTATLKAAYDREQRANKDGK